MCSGTCWTPDQTNSVSLALSWLSSRLSKYNSVAKTYFIQSIILYFGKVKELYFIYTSFQSNALEIPYYRIKLSKRIKGTLFILFFLRYRTHISSLETNEHIQKNFARAFGARINYTYIFQAMLF